MARTSDKKMAEFKKDLEHLINKHSIENGSDTPDFILANYLCNCLISYENAHNTKQIHNGSRIKGCEKRR